MFDKLHSNVTLWHLFIVPVALLSAVTNDRFVHLLWAVGFSLLPISAFLLILNRHDKAPARSSTIARYCHSLVSQEGIHRLHAIAMALFVLFLGSWIPDIDWKFKIHRSPISHSILPMIVLVFVNSRFRMGNKEWSQKLLLLFGYGLSSHLVSDIIPGGNVVGIPARFDMPFLFMNGIVVFAWSALLHWKLFRQPKRDIEAKEEPISMLNAS